ncbi:MAG: ABC transporter permease [Acidobacteriota bacterium]|nr:ABC transporter permease [Acidobacteriota bacterium]
MSLGRLIAARLRGVLRRGAVERDMDEEMRAHIEMEAESNLRRGMSPEEARRRALRSFGDVVRVKEAARDIRGGGMIETVWLDARYAARVLRKNPGFAAVAVVTLALGIGANTAIFSVVNAVLLRPLPYDHPEQLVRIGGACKQDAICTFSPPDFFDWRARNTSFEAVAAYDGTSPSLTGAGEPERLNGARVSPDFFRVLRVSPALGRAFLPQEERRGEHRVAILSHSLWQRRFNSDQAIVGRKIELGGEPFEVVGVMPEGFEPPQFGGLDEAPPDIWTPFAPDLSQWGRDGRSVDPAVARLKPGVTLAQARAEMEGIAARLQQEYPKTNKNAGVRLASLQDQLVAGVRPALLVFLAAVGLVLLIACANVANMLLARAALRQKEIALRSALGATRLRLARQLLTESLLLAALGGVVLPRGGHVGLDLRVALFTAGVTLLTGVLFGLAPALQSSRGELTEKLKEGGRGAAGGATRHGSRRLLVAAEIALSLVLLIGAGLLARSFVRLQRVDPGFDPENVLTMNVFLPGVRYPQDEQQVAFFEQVLERVRALPGVEHAGATSNLPVSGNFDQVPLYVEGQPVVNAGDAPQTERYMVSSDYFRALGVPLLEGRDFTNQDTQEGQRVTVIGETVAQTFFGGVDPVGRRIKIGDPTNPWLTIVGVAAPVHHYGLDTAPNFQIYVPHQQSATQAMTLVVRTAGDPDSATNAVRAQVWAVDPKQPVYDVRSMGQLLAASLAARRFNMILVAVFSAVALLLAAVGIYGVVAYAVAQRTHEIGVRMALGAQPRDVLLLVVTQGMTPALAGVGVGLACAFAITRAISGLLYGVSATDLTTFVSVSALLTAVALLACYLPARRATKVDPLIALRAE